MLKPDITIDLGNKNYKMINYEKRVIDSSSVQEVANGTFGSFVVNGQSYIIGKNARSKKNTNKICTSKKALLGRALYPVLEDKDKVEITTLLPLSLYRDMENRKKYKDLLKGKYTVTNPDGATKTFTITDVEVCAESFSSLLTDESLLKDPLYLVDIGGVDTSGVYVNKTPDMQASFTSEKGMNVFFAELAKELTSALLDSYREKDAELVFEKYDTLPENIKNIVDTFAENYVKENIYESLKDAGYKSLIHKLIFVGGGSKALERYLVKGRENVTVLEDALWSNVQGAKIIAIRRGKLAKKEKSKAEVKQKNEIALEEGNTVK